VEIDSENKKTISDWKLNALKPKVDSINYLNNAFSRHQEVNPNEADKSDSHENTDQTRKIVYSK